MRLDWQRQTDCSVLTSREAPRAACHSKGKFTLGEIPPLDHRFFLSEVDGIVSLFSCALERAALGYR
jgi:hypothetical protein